MSTANACPSCREGFASHDLLLEHLSAATCVRVASGSGSVRGPAGASPSVRRRSSTLTGIFKKGGSSASASPASAGSGDEASGEPSPLMGTKQVKNQCPVCAQSFATAADLVAHCSSCAKPASADLLASFEADLQALNEVSTSAPLPGTERGTTVGNNACPLCHQLFDQDRHAKKLCTNCTRDVCAECQRNVKLQSYNEQRVRVLCLPCVEDVKRKIVVFKSMGRGQGLSAPPTQSGAVDDVRIENNLGSGIGRGTRRASTGGRGMRMDTLDK